MTGPLREAGALPPPEFEATARPRLIPFARRGPALNMALDEALLRVGVRPTLRLYGWDAPTASLGHFQPAALAEGFARAGLAVVRRSTGGGAIVHDCELTYSVLLPLDHPWIAGADTRRTYALLHDPIQTALAALGVHASARPAADDPTAREAARAILCFERPTSLDLVVGGRKLVGSAQRRLPGRLLQHGSILVGPHPAQPGTASIREILGRAVAIEDVAAAVGAAFVRHLGALQEADFTPAEAAFAEAAAAGFLVPATPVASRA